MLLLFFALAQDLETLLGQVLTRHHGADVRFEHLEEFGKLGGRSARQLQWRSGWLRCTRTSERSSIEALEHPLERPAHVLSQR